MREGDTEGFGGKGRGRREGGGRERDSGIWVRGVEVNSRTNAGGNEKQEATPKERQETGADRPHRPV